ncbi:Aspartate aminotransferase [Prochlorococcus sp. MIT 0601]|nr:Aspartate aminotransferase [Prochlorococcus sp. MIT 0601]
MEINALAMSLKKEGKDICSLSAGEPDFQTPDFIVEAAIKALRDGITRYGPSAGDPELRQAIAKKVSDTNNFPTTEENVLITNGGKQAIFNLFQVILNKGDEVIIPSPYWLSYPAMAKLAGAVPKTVMTAPKDGFKLNLQKLESQISTKTKLLIINSPANPTGRVMQKEELNGIADILRKHPHVSIMSDEIYEFLISKEQIHHSIGAIAPDLQKRIFIVNGFAKGWAMTGWRVGYLVGPRNVIRKSIALQSQSTSNVCSFAQKGALAAMLGPKESVQAMATSYNERREVLTNGLTEIDGLTLMPQKGAFYAFPELPESCPDSISFCKLALEKENLAIVPGIAFGNDRCVRLSCAASLRTIDTGITRLKNLIKKISLN